MFGKKLLGRWDHSVLPTNPSCVEEKICHGCQVSLPCTLMVVLLAWYCYIMKRLRSSGIEDNASFAASSCRWQPASYEKNTKKKPEKAIGRTKIVHYFEWYYIARSRQIFFDIRKYQLTFRNYYLPTYLFQKATLSSAKDLRYENLG